MKAKVVIYQTGVFWFGIQIGVFELESKRSHETQKGAEAEAKRFAKKLGLEIEKIEVY